MHELSTNDQLIKDTKDLLHAVRGSLIHVASNLYKIKEEGMWEGRASNWSEFCEAHLEISQGQASKLLSIHDHFILKGGMTPEELAGVDYEKLNAVRKLPGTVEEQLEKARTLTRTEIKHEANDAEVVPHEFEEVCYCKVCGLSKVNHP